MIGVGLAVGPREVVSEDVAAPARFFFRSDLRLVVGTPGAGGPHLYALEVGPSCLSHPSVSIPGPKVEDAK